MLCSSPPCCPSSSLSLHKLLSIYQQSNPKSQRIKQEKTSLMAVEARHLNLFPPQLTTNRDFIKTCEANTNIYNTQIGSEIPFNGTMPETILPAFHQYSLVCDTVPAKTSMKADSGLTYNLPPPRKRSRDSMNQFNTFLVPQKTNLSDFSSSIGENIPLQIMQQQFEIDHIISEHTKKIRLEVEERQKQHARLLVSAIGEGMMKKLKEKDELIQKMGKLNWVLQERVKSLYMENHLWRDLALTNEATANSLRTNLEQVLAHVSDEPLPAGGRIGAVADDAESCCDSSDYGRINEEEERPRVLAEEGGDSSMGVKGKEEEEVVVGGGGKCWDRMCKNCGERESRVLLLPCRHLCLCTLCGSTLLQTCPVCNSDLNASLHVNMS
ncbi:BOI-related E3 ubiquitin-protein ligase 1-like [Cornus florida]|uniref:BOI-related E3 ubiquitin-protein ligase 1-like n=1 Tax=Cornus florida TaxID=4283 RepID=UPI00289BA992|nr:BOI-related E3 ubiquitin-protein ligase 1-like [Cornus florida]